MKNVTLRISKQILSALAGASFVLTTGCIEIKEPSVEVEQIDQNAKAALVQALDNQATHLIDGINQVIINGDFVKNIAVQNPPQPIPINDDNEVARAINYLLSYADARNGLIDYYPDSRICSDIIAKDNPRECTKIMEHVVLTQIPAADQSGALEVRISGIKLLTLAYSPNSVSLFLSAGEVVAALSQVSQIIAQDGGEAFAQNLPSTHDGAIQIDVSSQFSVSLIRAHVIAALDLRGTNQLGESYSVQAQTTQNVVSISLDSALGIVFASINLPQVQALFTAHDDQNTAHQVEVQFPGASASISLENSISTVAVQALQISGNDAYIAIDGAQAVRATLNNQINAEVQSSTGGNVLVSILSDVSAQLEINTNPLIDKTGTLSASIAQGTQVFVPYQATQAKILSGSIQLIGTLDFDGSLDAQANSCVESQQNPPLLLQTSVCQF